MVGIFFDTNIIVYLLGGDPVKRLRSEALVAAGGVISVQVLNEFVSAVRNPPRPNSPGRIATWAEIDTVLGGLPLTCQIVPLTLAIHQNARRIAKNQQIHIYDAGIVAAAADTGCTILLTEDMSDGQVIDGITIRNPYAGSTP